MLVSSKELLLTAKQKHFAIPSANFVDEISAKAHIEVAEEMNLPLILSFAQVHSKYQSLEEAANIGKYYANKAKVPIVLHLDHGEDFDFIKRAIDLGFTSVMIDASNETLDENIRITKEVVDYAHAHDVCVEAEIGHVGTGVSVDALSEAKSVYTSVEEAIKLTQETNLDSLAVSIGTAHGSYKGTPVINFERLKELSEALDVPLVLHGGSSSGDENLSRCAKEGIAKINIYTDFILNAYKNLQENEAKDYFAVKTLLKDGIKDILRRYYKVFSTQNI